MLPILRKPKVQIVLVLLFFGLATVPMFYPISTNMGTMVTDRLDGLLQTWMMTWNIHAWATGAAHWDANMFWPHPDALAYSDHMIGAALVAAPFYLITGNPILAHNAFTFLSFVIGGLGMFLFVRRLTGSAIAGFVAGIIFAYCPWRLGHVGAELNQLANQWLPWALLFFHRVLDDDACWPESVLLGIFVALNALGSYYHAAMCAAIIVTVFIVRLIATGWRLSAGVWLKLIAAGVVAAALVYPAVPPYYRVAESQGAKHTIKNVEELSADPMNYLRAAPYNRLWGEVTAPFQNKNTLFPAEMFLFTGFSVLLLAAMGLLSSKPRVWAPDKKAYFWVVVVCFVISLGPFLHIFGHVTKVPLPYLVVFYLVPPLQGLRSVARFGMAVETGLAVLAAYGFLYILDKIKNKKARAGWAVAVVSVLFIEFFSSPLPHHHVKVGDEIPEVYKWLASQEGDFPVIELPQMPDFTWLPGDLRYVGDPLGFRYMYYSTYHWKEMVNGRSSFLPPTNDHVIRLLTNFPSEDLVNVLRYHGVKYVILHSDDYYWENVSERAERVARTDRMLERAAQFGPDIVYKIPDPLDVKKRKWWEELETLEVFVPEGVKPGAKFNVEARLGSVNDALPTYSFRLVDFEATAEVAGPEGISGRKAEFRDFITIDPGDDKWVMCTFDAPELEGDYDWNVTLSIRDGRERKFVETIHFNQEVGDYPDSSEPDVLRATFQELDIPKTVKAGERFRIKAVVRNDGNTLWRAHRFNGQENYKGVVMLANKEWLDADGKPVNLSPPWEYLGRGFLKRSVPPGGTTETSFFTRAPERPGRYSTNVQMVDEYVAWFEDAGGEKVIYEIEVLPR